jgi:hypothetical protein
VTLSGGPDQHRVVVTVAGRVEQQPVRPAHGLEPLPDQPIARERPLWVRDQLQAPEQPEPAHEEQRGDCAQVSTRAKAIGRNSMRPV